MERMEHFEYVMQERVKGGVSNRADLMVVQQKLNQMRADLAADTEAAVAAMDEYITTQISSLESTTRRRAGKRNGLFMIISTEKQPDRGMRTGCRCDVELV